MFRTLKESRISSTAARVRDTDALQHFCVFAHIRSGFATEAKSMIVSGFRKQNEKNKMSMWFVCTKFVLQCHWVQDRFYFLTRFSQ